MTNQNASAEGTIHLHTRLENDDWTKRQEEVNALIVKAVGVEGWRKLIVQPEVRAEVRKRLDAHNATIADLQTQITDAKAKFPNELQEYLAPLAEQKAGFAAGVKSGAITPASVAASQGTGFGGKAAS